MSTPVIEAIDNVNQTSLNTVFAAVAADPTARDNLSQSDRNIDAVSTNVGVIESLNNNENAILRLLCRREGFDPANFADLDAVAEDQGLMQAIAARQESSKVLARSQKASAAAAASQVAMDEVGNSATARAEVYSSPTALSEIRPVDQAIAKLSVGEAGEDASSYPDLATLVSDATAMAAVADSQTAMEELVASSTAMQAVADSSTAMQEVISSPTALQEVADSQTAMVEVADSSTAMQEVANSQTALDEIGNNDTVQNTVYNNATGILALDNSNLKSSASTNIQHRFGSSLKGDRNILLSHDTGTGGVRSNQPVFSNSNSSFPQTADRIFRNASSNSHQGTTHSATFINISG
jgi:hypothetical protein